MQSTVCLYVSLTMKASRSKKTHRGLRLVILCHLTIIRLLLPMILKLKTMINKSPVCLVKIVVGAPYICRFCETFAYTLTERESQSKSSPAVPICLDSNRKEDCITRCMSHLPPEGPQKVSGRNSQGRFSSSLAKLS